MPTDAAPPCPDLGERGFYTVAEVADLLGFTRETVYKWISEGVLPAVAVGRPGSKRWRIDIADVHEMIRGSRRDKVV
jgi:excisionase family DNA binding protein